jgi:hypothetical protein
MRKYSLHSVSGRISTLLKHFRDELFMRKSHAAIIVYMVKHGPQRAAGLNGLDDGLFT